MARKDKLSRSKDVDAEAGIATSFLLLAAFSLLIVAFCFGTMGDQSQMRATVPIGALEDVLPDDTFPKIATLVIGIILGALYAFSLVKFQVVRELSKRFFLVIGLGAAILLLTRFFFPKDESIEDMTGGKITLELESKPPDFAEAMPIETIMPVGEAVIDIDYLADTVMPALAVFVLIAGTISIFFLTRKKAAESFEVEASKALEEGIKKAKAVLDGIGAIGEEKRAIIEAWIGFQDVASDKLRSMRSKEETVREFTAHLAERKLLPPSLVELVSIFERARYSISPSTQGDVQAARSCLDRIERECESIFERIREKERYARGFGTPRDREP
jgi:hypothetical protein